MKLTYCQLRHASIDAATRAARGLPEDLIRLCVGIEDPHDLLDDLERALIDAGAIEFNLPQNRYIRVPGPDAGAAISRAVEKLALDGHDGEVEWFVSAPGKVILFGEHAVVHGVVSCLLVFLLQGTFECTPIGIFLVAPNLKARTPDSVLVTGTSVIQLYAHPNL